MFKSTLALLLFSSSLLYAQDVNEIPKSTRESVELLTDYLTKGSSNEREKVDTIYSWITGNIAYDYKQLENSDPFGYQSPEETLKSGKAICNGYVQLFQDMLAQAGIESEIIEGYVQRNEPGYYEVLFESSHVWIAVKIDDKWHLADPTYDAGYIGRLKKKEKTYPKSWTQERHFASESQQQKWEEKIKEKKAKFDEKQSKKDPYTNKVGFVSNPSKTFYLIHPDTFLLTHMPVLPEWQLRDQTLSIEQFSLGDSVRAELSNPNGPSVDSKIAIDVYKEMDILEQWLYAAQAAVKFNPRNRGTAAVNYYNTVGVYLDSKLGRMLKRYPKLQTQPLWSDLIILTDSAAVNAKLALKNVKESKKNRTKYYKSSFKAESVQQKAIGKEAAKVESLFVKIDKTIGTSDPQIEEEIASINEKLAKYEPLVKNIKVENIQFESTDPQVMDIFKGFDSINLKIDSAMHALKYHRDHSAQQGFYDAIQEAGWHVRMSNAYVSIYSMSTIDSVKYHDLKAAECLRRAQAVAEDSVLHELWPKALSKSVKALDSYMKSQRTILKELETKGQVENVAQIEKNMTAIVAKRYRELLQSDFNSRAYNKHVSDNMRIISSGMDATNNFWKHLENSREERNERLQKELEVEYERLEKLYAKIQETSKQWKEELKTRLK
jgi:hypothetical protein